MRNTIFKLSPFLLSLLKRLCSVEEKNWESLGKNEGIEWVVVLDSIKFTIYYAQLQMQYME